MFEEVSFWILNLSDQFHIPVSQFLNIVLKSGAKELIDQELKEVLLKSRE